MRPDEQEDDSVILETRLCESLSLINRPTIYGNGRFLVSWPGAEQYPWTEFRAVGSDDIDDDESLLKVYKRFRRIAREFRSHGKNGLARIRVKIDNQRIMRGDLERKLVRQLVTDKILDLREGGQRYFWLTENAGLLLGVSWQDLKKGEIPQSLKDYLRGFIQNNPELF